MTAFALRVDSARHIPANRAAIEAMVQDLIDLLDRIDGDPDLEPNGDELDGSRAEDDWWPHYDWSGEAGCPISDPGEEPGDREHERTVQAAWGIDQTQLPTACLHTAREYRQWAR